MVFRSPSVLRGRGTMATVFNAANERAVAKFLKASDTFSDICEIIEEAMNRHQVMEHPDIEEIPTAEQLTYEWIESRW